MAREFDLTGYLYGPEPDAATPATIHVTVRPPVSGRVPRAFESRLTFPPGYIVQSGQTLTVEYTLIVDDD